MAKPAAPSESQPYPERPYGETHDGLERRLAGRHPHEMTRNDFLAWQAGNYMAGGERREAQKKQGLETEEKRLTAHKAWVKQALESGKRVPSEVLKDYPDLKPAAGQQPAAPVNEIAAARQKMEAAKSRVQDIESKESQYASAADFRKARDFADNEHHNARLDYLKESGQVRPGETPEDRFEQGRQAVDHGADTHDYHRTLGGVSEVMKDRGRTATTRGLANRWHDPLVNGYKTLAQAAGAMEIKAKGQAEHVLSGTGSAGYGTIFHPSFATSYSSGQTPATIRSRTKEAEKELVSAEENATVLRERAADIAALKPSSEVVGQLNAAADKIDKTVAGHRSRLASELKAAEKADRAETEKLMEARKFDPAITRHPEIKKTSTRFLISRYLTTGTKNDYLGTAKETGIATDGRFMVKLPHAEHEAIKADKRDLPGRKVDASQMESLLNSPAEQTPARVIAGRTIDTVPQYLLEGENGRKGLVDAQLHHVIMDRYPKATIHLGEGKGAPIHYRDGGRDVGIVAPLMSDHAIVMKESKPTESVKPSEPQRISHKLATTLIDQYSRNGFATDPEGFREKYADLSDSEKREVVQDLHRRGLASDVLGRKRGAVIASEVLSDIHRNIPLMIDEHKRKNHGIPFSESEAFKRATGATMSDESNRMSLAVTLASSSPVTPASATADDNSYVAGY